MKKKEKKVKKTFEEESQIHVDLGPKAFIPLFTFLFVYVGAGMIAMALGYDKPFNMLPKECALILGLAGIFLIGRRVHSLDYRIEVFSKAAGDSTVILMIVIFLLAGVFANTAKAAGCDTSMVNLGLTVIPPQFIIAGVFVVSALIALAIGTSNGTVAAIAPIALGLCEQANLNVALAMAAVVGGAMFGDNLSVISDTTIAATRGAGAEMSDKFKMNLLVALPASLITFGLYAVLGHADVTSVQIYEYSLLKIVPYLFVLIAAIAGMNVVTVLIVGTLLAGGIGIATGAISFVEFFQSVGVGVNNMATLAVVTILIRGLAGIAQEYGGIDWMLNKIICRVHTRKGAEYAIAAMCTVADACVGANTLGVLISSPLAVPLARKYNIAPKRIASLVDVFCAAIQGLLPHGGQIMLVATMAGISPFAVIAGNFYQVLLAVCMLITIKFGLLRTREEREGIPIYPEAQAMAEEQTR